MLGVRGSLTQLLTLLISESIWGVFIMLAVMCKNYCFLVSMLPVITGHRDMPFYISRWRTQYRVNQSTKLYSREFLIPSYCFLKKISSDIHLYGHITLILITYPFAHFFYKTYCKKKCESLKRVSLLDKSTVDKVRKNSSLRKFRETIIVLDLFNSISSYANHTAGPQLNAISTMSSGTDHIDLDEVFRRGLPIGNTPKVLDNCVADICVGLLIAATRRFKEGVDEIMR